MIKKIFIFAYLISVSLLSGCTTVPHIPMNKNNNQLIKTIYINPEIKKPAQMYEFASGSEFNFMLGAVGGVISGLANVEAAISTQQFAENNKIDIRKIVYQRWKNQIAEKTRFKLGDQLADAVLTTEIVSYGITIPHGFSTDYIPLLRLNVKMVRNNQIVWQNSGAVTPFTSGLPRYKMNEIINDPKKLYAMWDKACEIIINQMLDDMNK